MDVRAFQPDDRDALVSMMDAYGAYAASIDPHGVVHHGEGFGAYFVDRMLERTRDAGMVLVADDGEQIGFVGGVVRNVPASIEMPARVFGFIDEIHVRNDRRRSGIGSLLLRTIEDEFQRRGCTVIKLGVFAPNDGARAFYEASGYEPRDITLMKALGT